MLKWGTKQILIEPQKDKAIYINKIVAENLLFDSCNREKKCQVVK